MVARLRHLGGWRADGVAFVLGILAAAALPPVTLVPVLLVSVPGLLVLIGGAPGWRGAARRGFSFGLGLHLAGLYWITEAILVRAAEFWWAVPIAVPLLSAVLALFIAIPAALCRLAQPGWRRVCVLAGCWVLGDLARQFIGTGFPWNMLGSVWEMPGTLGALFMQPAAWVGIHGLTLFTLLLAASPVMDWRGRAWAFAGLLAWTGLGAVRLQVPAGATPDLRAVIVQGNIPETEHMASFNDQDWAARVFQKHLDLTRAGVHDALAQRDGPVFVVWPETASPYWLVDEPQARAAIAQAAAPAIVSLVGAPRHDAAGAHNSLIAVRPDGMVAGTYDKYHLVPYGEYFPSYLPFRLGELGWVPGVGIHTLHLLGLAQPGFPAIGPLICYEAIFPAQVVQQQDRPAFLVNITNDAWFGDSAGPRQHLAAARMRTVEEGLPMIRAANTGISAVIDAHGRVLLTLGLDRTGTLIADLPGRMAPTPVSRMGLAAPLLLALGSSAAGFGLGRRRPAAEVLGASKKTLLLQ